MVNTRILERRRLRAGRPVHRQRSRHRLRGGWIEQAGVATAARLRTSRHVRLYAGVVLVVTLLVAYLVVAAQVTQASYELARLQNRQAELLAEQAQLRYQEADLHTPAQVERDAQQAGLQRRSPAGYPAYQASAIALDAPIGQPPADRSPTWQRALASLIGTVSGIRDAAAGER